MHEKQLDMKYHGLVGTGMKAISTALMVSADVRDNVSRV